MGDRFGTNESLYDLTRVMSMASSQSASSDTPLPGPGITVDGFVIGLSGNTILLYDSGGAVVSEFPATQAGFILAQAAWTSGDTILLPSRPIAFTAGVTIAETIHGFSLNSKLNFSGFGGAAITLTSGGWLEGISINFDGAGQATATGISAAGVTLGTKIIGCYITVINAAANYGVRLSGNANYDGPQIDKSWVDTANGTNNICYELGDYAAASYCYGGAKSGLVSNIVYDFVGTQPGISAPLASHSYAFGGDVSAGSWGAQVESGKTGRAALCYFSGATGGLKIAAGGTLDSYGNMWSSLSNLGTINYLDGDRSGPGGTTSGAAWSNPWHVDDGRLLIGSRTKGVLESFHQVGLSGVTNPIIACGIAGQSDHFIREIGNVLYEPNETQRRYKTFYTGYDAAYGTDEKIHYAYSEDGKTWTKSASNPVINTRRAEDPYVARINGVYYLYAEDKEAGGDDHIRRWHSNDCETWIDDGQITGITDVQSPTVWIEGSTWYLLYEQYPTAPHDIRLATSVDGLAWTAEATNPVMSAGDTTWVLGSIVDDDIIKIGRTYYMTYHGGLDALDAAFAEGIAKSTDLLTWTDLNSPFASSDSVKPIVTASFLFDDRLTLVYYVANAWNDDSEGIYRGYPIDLILTLASDAITIDADYAIVKAQSGTADNLDTINGGAAFQLVVIQPYTGHTITVKHGTGNIYLNTGTDVALSGDQTLALFFDGVNWSDMSDPGSNTPSGSVAAGYHVEIVMSSGILPPDPVLTANGLDWVYAYVEE